MKNRVFRRCTCGALMDASHHEEYEVCGGCTRQKYEEVWSHRVSPEFNAFKAILYGCLLLLVSLPANASPSGRDLYVNPESLCKAIYEAEGGANTKYPYGIMTKYKTTTPRQACINTVKSAWKRYEVNDEGMTFVAYLGRSYAPLGAKNDPSGLNINWIKNVSWFFYGE